MRQPLPTPLPSVDVAGSPRRGVLRVVVASAGEDDGDIGAPARRDPWVLGVGAGTAGDWRTAGAVLSRALTDVAERCDVELPADADAAAFTLGLALGGYGFKVTGQERPRRVRSVRLVTGAPVADAVREALDAAAATALARDLANTPSNTKDPAWLAATTAKLAGAVPGLDVRVRDEKWLRAEGFGGVLAVGGGSPRPPRLVELAWRGTGGGPHLVFVGKGITFDTGGISIKPAEGMHLMRTDMAGGAAVIAATIAAARRRLPVRVTALVPCAENHVSGSAYRPGDVIRHHGGTTTEVTNTDAEGRLVLADALAYAVRTLSPDLIVDVATLTGAMKISLGVRTAGLFATDDALAADLLAAGEAAAERYWRMPLLQEHADAVHSDLADLRQCPPGPGGIMAALFLREFAADVPWAHLDIAGPARSDKSYAEVTPGATGFAARTLLALATAKSTR
ncbi:M17 family metallopeptidase [Saccharothrix violaceirubra]|uniref:Probable cytosol aminopeptidase n=1 Tax=Saccharothrix violaceirubra TaxID=413306 RepID=A0A7W7TAQ2_9PSEU|nr:M17 family metallopeptidase [Saccharothrix violaceirubra]MBB4968340.1 leucyl aminopeptidase [Saccharothrix violaceirubra]